MLTSEFKAMTPLQKWETLALNGLLGTDEPWIADMRDALTTLQAREATLINLLREARLLLYAQVRIDGPHQQCGSMIEHIDEALATSDLAED